MQAINLFAFISTFILFLFVVILFMYKKWKRTSNRILLFLLVINTVYLLSYLLFRMKVIPPIKYQYLNFIGNFLLLLLGVMIFLYIKSLCFSDFKAIRKHWIHFVPFLFLSVAVVIYFHLDSLIHQGNLSAKSQVLNASESGIFYLILHIFLLVYVIGMLRLLRKYRIRIKNYYSNIRQIDPSWLVLVIIAFIIMWILDIGISFQAFIPWVQKISSTVLISASLASNLIFAFLIVSKGISSVEILNGKKEEHIANIPTLTQEQIESYAFRFKKQMQDEKPYLEPLLTLSSVAQQLSLPPRHLSQALNRTYKKNFFEIISDFRIEEAKRMLKDPTNREKSILEICYDVGFNSKSSFNSLFKQKTGLTPSQFKKM